MLDSFNHQPSVISHPFGISDADFALLDGREKMITKMPIRLLTLQALELPKRRVFWDIGFCTGSVSIEARLQFPHLQIEAFEIRPECEAIIHENACRFGAPGINIHIGNFLETDISSLPHPDAVFIGGHGGHLKEIMAKVLTVLTDDGIIVFNSVTSPVVTQMTDRPSSRELWDEACEELHLHQAKPTRIVLDDNNPIEILRTYRKNRNKNSLYMQDNNKERFPIVDEEGNVTGSATRGECHNGSKLLHPVVHLHVFNSRGEVYLQKRPEWKDIQPGKWDTSVGGHIDYGETPEDALLREVREELGITAFTPERIGQYVFDGRREREFVYVNRTVYDGEIRPSTDELAGGRFWTIDEIREVIGKDILTPNFESEFTKFFLNQK